MEIWERRRSVHLSLTFIQAVEPDSPVRVSPLAAAPVIEGLERVLA
jgi:hypothetical protein